MLDGIPITDLAPSSLLAVAVLLIFLGLLIPRRTFNEKKEEAERWRLAYENERNARQVSDLQTVELLELAKTTHALISAIVRNGGPTASGGSDVATVSSSGPEH